MKAPSHDRPLGWQWLGLSAAYVVAARLEFTLTSLAPSWLPVGLSAGLALGALLVLGTRAWPGIWLGAFLAGALIPAPWWISAVAATGTTIAAVVGAVLIRRLMHGRAFLAGTSEALGFMIGALLATLLSATFGTLWARWVGPLPPESLGDLWRRWWLEDLLGALLVAPLLLSAGSFSELRRKPARIVEGVGLALLLVVASYLVFGSELHHYPLAFLPVPMVVWVALRFGVAGAAIASLLMACVALYGTLRGLGPFGGLPRAESYLLLQWFMGVVSLTGLLLAAEITQRKRAEAFFAEFVEETDDVLTRVDGEGHLTYVNPASRRIFGLPPAECLGRSAFEFIHPDDRNRTWNAFTEWRQSRVPSIRIENRQVSQTGEVHHVLWTVTPHFDSSGDILALTSIGRDITDRKKAEEAMSQALREARDSETRYRTLFESAAMGINLVDTSGRSLECNRALQQLLGYSLDDLRAMTFTEYTHPDDRDVDWGLFQEVVAGTRDSYQVEKRYYRKDGRMVWARLTVSPIRDAEGRIRQILGMMEDITDRKEVEDALRASEAKLRAIVEHAPDVVFIKDLEGRYLLVNPALGRFVGRSLEEVLGLSDLELFPPEVAQRIRSEDQRVLASGELHVFEETLTDAAGSERSLLALKYPYLSPDGRMLGLIGIARDLTELKRTTEEVARRTAERDQARELARLKDHFLSTISHEMKTPLSLIIGYTELLEDQCPGKEELAGIMDGSRRLTEHLNKVLDYSALLSESLPLYMGEVNLSEVLENVRQIVTEDREFCLKGLHFEAEFEPDTPSIVGDSRRVTQLLLELLDNAKKFTPSGGRIGVRIGRVGGEIRIEVWDTGSGIRQTDLARIWEAFTQLETEQALRRGGLGLGLTIVKKLAELHGGRVEVESQEGKGSRFSVFLPSPTDRPGPPEAS